MSRDRGKRPFIDASRRRAFALGTVALAVLAAPSARAATVVWGGGNGTFSTAANWVEGAAPGSSDTVLFSGWAPLSRSGWTVSASLGTGASNAKDGDRSTQWTANTGQASGQYFIVDLGSTQTFRQITMDSTTTSTDYPRAFDVYVSANGSSWGSPVTSGTGSSALVTVTLPTAQTYRYIKIQLTTSSGNWWRIGELFVYGTAAETELSRNGWTASASASGGGAASNAIDDNYGTKWSPGAYQAVGQWFSVDMGSSQTFTRIDMDAYSVPTDYPRGYDVYVSSDGTNWGSPIASQTPTSPYTSITFSSQTKRYIKVMLDTANGSYWWGVFEFKVYGTPANCNITSNASVTSISLDKSLTVTQSSAVTLSVSGSYSQSAGTFTGGNSAITVGGSFDLSGGTFTSTSGLLEIDGAYTGTGGTFTHNSGRVMLASTSSQTFAPNSATFNNLIINDGLVGYWRLDETVSPATDYSGYGNDLTWQNSATSSSTVPSTINFTDPKSLSLNGGTTDAARLAMPSSVQVSLPLTISAWYSATTTDSGGGEILSGGDSYLIRLSATGLECVKYKGSSTWVTISASPSGYKDGNWHHIDCVLTTSGMTMYFDGSSVATNADTGAIVYPASCGTPYLIIGRHGCTNTTTDFTGKIDEVRIYSRALSATEITSLYLGNQPATSVATQSMSGSATVSGDLTIASGGLYLSTYTINLVGDWWNYGGVFWADYWGTATLNLTGTSTTNYIRSAGQVLPTINITGTGKWTLADNLDVDPNSGITFTTGSMDISTKTLRVGDLNSGSGTFTASSGTVVLNANGNQTVNVSGYNILRVEDPTETNLVGYWKLDEGQGSGSRDWAGNGHTGTLAGGAEWTASVPGTSRIEYHDPYAISLDGSTGYIDAGSAATPSNAALTACAWVNHTGVSATQTLVSIDGTNISGVFLKKNNASPPKFALEIYASDSTGAAAYIANGTTTVATATWYHVCGVYTGSVSRIYVNGTQEGSDTTVSGSFNATGNTIIGAGKWGGARVNYVNGVVDDVRIYNVALSAAQIKALGAGRYAGTGGTATITLGANVTATSTFAIDSGGLNTSSYTFGTATGDSTKVAYVGGGTLTVGSSTATFSGGLTVRDEGTLSMQTTGGVTALGSGKTLTMDGTLDASTASTVPTIQAASGSYTFTVGSSSTATPVLNIDGLAVKNTGVDGMYINAVAGSSTTFTKFDNIAFSNGSASASSTYIRIYSTSLSLVSSGNTFTFSASKPDYAVKLAGNGTGDGETRAIFGAALCPSSLCTSSNKSDDDANNNGVGDTPASNGAVVQFVRGAPSDTAGTIEGFPTAAFDWNLFTYYSTYVAYRNFSGSQDRLFVRSSSGGASYHWDLPTAAGHIVGTPRWTQLSNVKYVYVGTTAGYVYKLIDNGSSSLTLPSSPWDTPYCHGGSPCDADDTITSPLAIDGTNVYWVGTDTAANRKFFVLTHGKTLTSAALTIPAAVTAAPALTTVSSIDYLFAGMQGYLYRIKVSDQSSGSWTQPATTSTINGRVTIFGSLAYVPDNRGHIYVVNTSTLATDWTYQDTGNHGGSCGDAGNCTIKNLYVDGTSRVMYGDQDGHVYVITKNGGGATVMTGYPTQPAAGEAITTAPLYQAGIMVVGTSSGSVFVINVRTASSGTPATLATYKLGSAVSTISYNANTNSSAGAYMVGTASGKLFFIDKVSDGDAYP